MLIAEKLRKSNIAEYLLYMWQVEDLLRAFGLDFDKLKADYLSRFSGLADDERQRMEEWYRQLIDMMHREGVTERGHLQICKNVLINLSDLHHQLSTSDKYTYYQSAYMKVLPIVVTLRQKNGNREENELETCFNFLYGNLLLRLQKKPVTESTQQAVEQVTTFLAMLSDYYQKDQVEPLEL